MSLRFGASSTFAHAGCSLALATPAPAEDVATATGAICGAGVRR